MSNAATCSGTRSRAITPVKLFEYLYLAKAIVAPRQPNIEEVLTDGANALLFDPAQPGELEAALSRLCEDAGLRARLSAGAGATTARLGLTWDANAGRVAEIARALLAAPRRDG
jgi:glycosyltransferase involved in cell wall biosynthesis